MHAFWITLLVLAIGAACFVLGRTRALASADGNIRNLHSLPAYYGWNAALWAAGPAILVLICWMIAQPVMINRVVAPLMVTDAASAGSGELGLLMSDVRRVADGLDRIVASGTMSAQTVLALDVETGDLRDTLASAGVAVGTDVSAATLNAAQEYRVQSARWLLWRMIVVIAVAVLGGLWALRQTGRDFRARNSVETTLRGLLVGAASLAILTTVGIVFALIFNTVEFFRLYPAADFFFGTVWSPSFGGGSSLGILPLLWGTLYISVIALLVAVPIGLFAAIYLSEYASPRVRAFAKPMLEVLAGIPTIVYGLFALLTVGPLLVSAFGDGGLFGVNWMQGGTAVMTAGLVMGIMLIPFVSSLSDDIINAVPQAMRDGSLGLGATKSETIRQVVLPAALPGIAGAILLAASRAIGETMIVVLGAGAAARLAMNPFEAMTTVTAKIVSQLTGDADFSSPEALVAFSLGMTLFVITLGLNIFALWIVRRYREQYE
ncbi:phosphate ABC transporter permease subunit PstC [Octadecabacter sp. R77987]|uniref:phosphate ABC transporter permease subunit PstC n=1 Tax=Octadecabacter sp. R77987 TaxID=3093874 RepID=UPI0036710BB4